MENRRFYILFSSLALLLLCGIVALVTLAGKPSDKSEFFANPSIYNEKGSGYMAWSRILQKAGLSYHSWRLPFKELDKLPNPAVMVLIEPLSASSRELLLGDTQVKKLLKWVNEGNTLIFIDSFNRTGANALLENMNVEKPYSPNLGSLQSLDSSQNSETFLHIPSEQGKLGTFVHQKIMTETRNYFVLKAQEKDKMIPLLLDDKGNPRIVEVPFGAGKVILGTPVDLANNKRLHELKTDNYQFLTNLVASQPGPVYINEYVHGFSEIPDVLSYYSRTPLGKIFLQLLTLFSLLLWLSFKRWKPARPVPEPIPQASSLEFIESLANIYYRSQAACLILSPMVQQIEIQLRNRYGMSLSEPQRVQWLFQTMGTLQERQYEQLTKAQQIIEKEQKMPPQELMKLVQELMLIQETLRYATDHYSRSYTTT